MTVNAKTGILCLAILLIDIPVIMAGQSVPDEFVLLKRVMVFEHDAYVLEKVEEICTYRDGYVVKRTPLTSDVLEDAEWGRAEGSGRERRVIKGRATLVRHSLSGGIEAWDRDLYDLWLYFGSDRWNNPTRWQVTEGTLYTARHSDFGVGGQFTIAVRWPIDLMTPGRGAMLDLNSPEGQKISRAWTDFRIDPVGSAMMGGIELAENGYRTSKFPGYRGQGRVYFDFRALDQKRVELLMTIEGRPSLWEYDGTQDTPEWKNRPSMAGKRVMHDPDEPRLAADGWHHKKNLSVTVEGPFLWTQDARHVVAEREGVWCVIGPLDAAEPEARAIGKKDPDHPLFLIEDVHAGKDYLWQGDRLMDRTGRVVQWIARRPKKGNALPDVVEAIVSRRRR